MTILGGKPMETLAYAGVGLLLRIITMTTIQEPIKQRVEVITPINNWKRAHEAVHLWDAGLDPYSGNLFHEYPISLQFYKILISYLNVDLAFATIDIFTAIIFQHSVFKQLIIDEVPEEDAVSRSMRVLKIYLLSPLNIIVCAGTSTSIFTNFLIALISLIVPYKSLRFLTCILCALLACNNIHYSTLILPALLCIEYCSNKNNNNAKKVTQPSEQYYHRQDFSDSLTMSIFICLVSIITLIATSFFLMGNSWTFLKSTYLFILNIKDLTPNIGMFWYFFTEIFDHFLNFFTWVVGINAFIHVIPLSIALRDSPFFALYMMIITSSIFQPYPSLSNISLIVGLLPQWSELFPHMKRGFIVFWTGLTCMSLWPIFWHLWIVMGTANANFYFGATLAFTVALIFFMVDLLNAHGYLRAKLRFDETAVLGVQKDEKQKTN